MVGETLGSYRITRAIGEGGMGTVYLAEHTLLGRHAAIKVLRPEMCHRPDLVIRFFNEARAASTVQHPAIVEIFDFGHRHDGSAFIVMELLHGESLSARMRRVVVMPEVQAVSIVRQLCSGLGAAHAKGIIHRDIKPDNIFLVPDPFAIHGERIKILDFGIAKLAAERVEDGMRTRTGVVLGTPTYMAPEQCKGTGEVDHRADLYALGCILYAMICGRPPFESEGMGELMGKHIYEAPPPPSTLARISPALEQVILRALAKNRDARHATADELAAALEAAISPGAPTAAMVTLNEAAQPAGPGAKMLVGAQGSPVTPVARPGPVAMHGRAAMTPVHAPFDPRRVPTTPTPATPAPATPVPFGTPVGPPLPPGTKVLSGLESGAGMMPVAVHFPVPMGTPAGGGAVPVAPHTPVGMNPMATPANLHAEHGMTPVGLGRAEMAPRLRRRTLLSLVALAVCAGAAALVFALARGSEPDSRASDSKRESEPGAPGASAKAAPPPAPSPAPVADEAATPPAPAASAESPAPPTAPAEAAAPASIKLRITSTPDGADVYRMPGRERVGKTPVEVTQPSAPGQAAFLLERRGHHSASVELPADRDGSSEVRLRARSRGSRDRDADEAPLQPGTTLNPFERR
jgi:eukaryotic-like serine/threonine-protein kinase